MTGLQDDDIKQIALNLGAFDLMNKPIAANEIIEKIEQALAYNHSQSEDEF